VRVRRVFTLPTERGASHCVVHAAALRSATAADRVPRLNTRVGGCGDVTATRVNAGDVPGSTFSQLLWCADVRLSWHCIGVEHPGDAVVDSREAVWPARGALQGNGPTTEGCVGVVTR
jgi:hypothetical protein